MPRWDPDRYLQFADQRSRPFAELVGRVGAQHPETVVDLGCGPGQLTAMLTKRWPQADVMGIDSSPEMIQAAQQHAKPGLSFAVADVENFAPERPADVVISSAVLQWVDDHRRLLPQLVEMVAPDGWLALQVPGNQEEPSHTLLHQLANDPRFSASTGSIERRLMPPPATYLADLSALGCDSDVWETTYLHVLTGVDPVFDWISGTGARPYLQALSDAQREIFVAEYKRLLRQAYPPQPFGTVLPFRRIFAVAHKQA